MMVYDKKENFFEVSASDLAPGTFFRFCRVFDGTFTDDDLVFLENDPASNTFLFMSRRGIDRASRQALVWIRRFDVPGYVRRFSPIVLAHWDHVSHEFMRDDLRVEVVEWASGLLSISVADDERQTYFDTLIPESCRSMLADKIEGCVNAVRTLSGSEDADAAFRAITNLSRVHHDKMVDKGFWDCTSCDGTGTVDDDRCRVCFGTGKHRDEVKSLMLIASEAFEAFEGLRRPSRKCDACGGTGLSHKDGAAGVTCEKCDATGAQLGGSNYAEEIADIVIRCLDEAGGRGIDLGEVMRHKMAYNDTRPHKHGKSF